jgi:hypothetical protein
MFIVESVGEVDEKACDVNKNLNTNLSNVESVHSQFGSHLLNKNELNFVTMDVQASKWKSHNMSFICWGLFVINGNLPIDLENSQIM